MFREVWTSAAPLRWGMVGGGQGSEIGYIHRSSACRDGGFKFVAGALDVDAERGREFGVKLGLSPERCYSDYKTMFAEEAKREDGIQAVTICVPNFLHYEVSREALLAGLHVVCEKPLCFTLEEAEELKALAIEKNRMFGVTYGYTGFPMVHQARQMIARGDIGDVRIIKMQFAHGFQTHPVESKSAGTAWRVNPKTSGSTYVLGDLGTHCLYMSQMMVPGLEIEKLLCTRQSFVASRAPLEDNATVLLQYKGGAVGTLWATSVNAGSTHQQKIRVIGSKASIEWWDEHPNQLSYEVQGEPVRILEHGMDYLYLDDEMTASNRMGSGHSEGLFESWSGMYRRFAECCQKLDSGAKLLDVLSGTWVPNILDGVEGVRFVEHCVESADNGSLWVEYI
ncbi:MAG: Gfo/Idh/MocA family oxidoreductase [Hungatella sp.]|nr:Gfo/Idh/MocA family oxidoreductase [Hungatella sp.]